MHVLDRALLSLGSSYAEPGRVATSHGSNMFCSARRAGLLRTGGESARGLDLCGQATKGAWGMSWRQEALKGVEDCEKLGGAVKRVLIPRYPNQRTLNP